MMRAGKHHTGPWDIAPYNTPSKNFTLSSHFNSPSDMPLNGQQWVGGERVQKLTAQKKDGHKVSDY